MKMKLHAVGDAKIPDFDRAYHQVVLPGGTPKTLLNFWFFSKVYLLNSIRYSGSVVYIFCCG